MDLISLESHPLGTSLPQLVSLGWVQSVVLHSVCVWVWKTGCVWLQSLFLAVACKKKKNKNKKKAKRCWFKATVYPAQSLMDALFAQSLWSCTHSNVILFPTLFIRPEMWHRLCLVKYEKAHRATNITFIQPSQ